MQQPGEPSVEEILESIKKVIAREHAAPASADRRRETGLSEPVEPAAPEEAEEVLELDEAADDHLAEGEEETGARYAEARSDPADGDRPLTGAASVTAMRENFAALAMLAQPGRSPQIVRSGETSLEELTRDLLRPMLARWLDDNLPVMVEELVKAEIARIAGKKN